MFTINVPKGNDVANIAADAFDTKNRQPPPKKLPQPTIKKSLNKYITNNILGRPLGPPLRFYFNGALKSQPSFQREQP